MWVDALGGNVNAWWNFEKLPGPLAENEAAMNALMTLDFCSFSKVLTDEADTE